jgi:hypothetical protein
MAYIEDRLTAIESKLDAILAGLSKAAPAASASASETKKGKAAAKAEKPAEQPAETPATKGPDITGDLERLRAALMAARDKGISPKQLLSKLGFEALGEAKTRADVAKIEDALAAALDPVNDILF